MKHRALIALVALLLVAACGSGAESTTPDVTLAAAAVASDMPEGEAPAASEATMAPTNTPAPAEAAPATQTEEPRATQEPTVAPAEPSENEESAQSPTEEPGATHEPTVAPTEPSENQEQPAASPTTPPTQEPAATSLPEATAPEEPSVTAPPAPTEAPAAAQSQPSGAAGFRDSLAVADQFMANLSSVPVPAEGQAYQGWLVADDGTTISIGVFAPNPDGSLGIDWNSPNSENLLGRYARFQLTLEPAAGSSSPTGQVVVSGGLEGEDLVIARRLFVENSGEPATPLDTALALGLKAQSDVAAQHAQNAANAAAIGALGEMQHHLEHTINILEGQAGPRYGDYTGEGTAENPGDGFGAIAYANQILQLVGGHEAVAGHAAAVQAQSAAIQDKAQEITGIQDIGAASAQLAELVSMAEQLQSGPVAGLYAAAQEAIRFEVSAAP